MVLNVLDLDGRICLVSGGMAAELPLAPAIVLFGPNDAGKSMVLRALMRLLGHVEFPPRDVVHAEFITWAEAPEEDDFDLVVLAFDPGRRECKSLLRECFDGNHVYIDLPGGGRRLLRLDEERSLDDGEWCEFFWALLTRELDPGEDDEDTVKLLERAAERSREWFAGGELLLGHDLVQLRGTHSVHADGFPRLLNVIPADEIEPASDALHERLGSAIAAAAGRLAGWHRSQEHEWPGGHSAVEPCFRTP